MGLMNATRVASRLVAISRSTKQRLLHWYPALDPQRVHVIYPASRFAPDSPTPAPATEQPSHSVFRGGTPFLLSVGTIEPRKNFRMLVEAYCRFRSLGGADVPLVIAGKPGWLMEDFLPYLSSLPYSKSIHCLGRVSDASLLWLYQHCLLNLYPSLYEGFGLPVLEALQQGAPTVASASTSMPEVLGQAGELLPPDDPDAWAQCLLALLSSPDRRRQMAVDGISQAAKFSWRRSVDQLLQVYAEALG